MSNVLPPHDKKYLKREYTLRLFTVFFLFLLSTGLFATILLLPSYFISQSKEASIERQSQLLQRAITFRESDRSTASLVTTKQKLNELAALRMQTPHTDVISAVVRSTDSTITVDAFYYTKKSVDNAELKITGRALSRAALLSFSDRLKRERVFERVDLPVSSLARDANIVFSITLEGDF